VVAINTIPVAVAVEHTVNTVTDQITEVLEAVAILEQDHLTEPMQHITAVVAVLVATLIQVQAEVDSKVSLL
jgi:hypothetical protein